MEISDCDILENLDWDPVYLSQLFSEDFFDMSSLWNDENFVPDGDLIKCDSYKPIVEDISMDDQELRSAVELIEMDMDMK